MVRVRLGVRYDGTEFAGWATQRELRTVQGVLTEALARVTRHDVQLRVAGRTDAGVHATGQVVQCDLPDEVWHDFKSSLTHHVNSVLPHDLRVYEAYATTPQFDARFSAVWRRYMYRIADTYKACDPLRRRDTVWPHYVRGGLDVERMHEASQHLLGEQNFAAFCRKREGATTIRSLLEFSWHRHSDGIVSARVKADAFCHSMVRSLVGAMLAVGRGKRGVAWPASLLQLRERTSHITVAPAHGLTLVEVGYPPPEEYAARTQRTQALRAPINRDHTVFTQ